jgi:hypothetical protein
MSGRRVHLIAWSFFLVLLIGVPIHVFSQDGTWVDVLKGIMGLLMLAAFAHFTWMALVRPRTHAVDFGDAGFKDEEIPKEEEKKRR